MHTIAPEGSQGRSRRTYSASFKSDLVAQCSRLGVSSAAVAISHGMNPNVLRRWIKESGRAGDKPKRRARNALVPLDGAPGFVALPLNAVTDIKHVGTSSTIRIELQRNGITVSVSWPASQSAASAAWVRDVLR